MTKVNLTQELFDQLEEVRLGGQCDMFDVGGVVGELTALGHTKAILWLTKNPHTYSRLVLNGHVIGDTLDTDSGNEIGESIIDELDNHFAQDADWKREHNRYNCPQCNATNVLGKKIESEEVSESIDDIEEGSYVCHVWTRYECTCPKCDYIWYEDESDSFVV